MMPIPDVLLHVHLQNHWSVALTFLSVHGRRKKICSCLLGHRSMLYLNSLILHLYILIYFEKYLNTLQIENLHKAESKNRKVTEQHSSQIQQTNSDQRCT